ncbi:hypothetical protein DN069_36915 [Streptacidiphilus pinicola]|uniref:Fe2OG dioxygenase domain-containing protein n=1 Tax=Streptacidiphilus pinicola TaxID=2219663 RepID=A0A2X0K039_9ACTN|nr:hypothetical protein [Streptacidiphilus pinicola]RAG80680.1 hypothetical protein DN069_36915 [Streptacidiphilus pinicola]
MTETKALNWGQHWTHWLRWKTTVKSDPNVWKRTFPTIADEIAELNSRQRIASQFVTAHELFTAENLSAMTTEAAAALRSATGFIHNGKWNAPVDSAALDFIDRVGLATLVSELAGVEVEEPQGATYIGYFEPGQFLDFHVDDFSYGEVNLIICLSHTGDGLSEHPSSTVFIERDGYRLCNLHAGDYLLFDGAFTPHGRTPVAAGEEVVLVSFSFKSRNRALWDVAGAPPAPADTPLPV